VIVTVLPTSVAPLGDAAIGTKVEPADSACENRPPPPLTKLAMSRPWLLMIASSALSMSPEALLAVVT
jgi:hypothetical protein